MISPQPDNLPAPLRMHRIFAGLLTIYIGYKVIGIFVLASSISNAYSFVAGVMSGYGSSSMSISIPLPALLLFVALLIGGLLYCGKNGKGSSMVWLAALIILPVSVFEIYLHGVAPPIFVDEPSFITLIINILITVYLIWVLQKASSTETTIRERVGRLFSLKTMSIVSLFIAIAVVEAFSEDISYEYNKRFWSPPDQIAGLSLGLSEDRIKTIQQRDGWEFDTCSGQICSWNHESSYKRPTLLVDMKDDKAIKIHTLMPSVTGDEIPFKSVEQMHDILGKEDIFSYALMEKYTYLKWNVTYVFDSGYPEEIELGIDDWAHEPTINEPGHYYRFTLYYIKGRQVCPSEACPWDLLGNLKPEFENASYRDFLSPSPEVTKMLDNAKEYEKISHKEKIKKYDEKVKQVIHADALKKYKSKAEGGSADDQYSLGNLYYRNAKEYGFKNYYPKAIKWLRMAADQNYTKAQYNLGLLYEDDVELTQDYAEAMKWYGIAAENGSSKAMNRLGLMNKDGKGVPKNLVAAYKWFYLSYEVINEHYFVKRSMTKEEINKAITLATEWEEKHRKK